METRKNRTNPFKILVLCLYSRSSFIKRSDDDQITVARGPMCRVLRVPSFRLTEYLEWLQMFGYISDLTDEYGKSTFKIKKPNLNWDNQNDRVETRV